MKKIKDRLAEATFDKYHWNDPGMDKIDAEWMGWKEFSLGTRVEVRTEGDVWRKGTIVETSNENDRAIYVICDKKWHNNLNFYRGRGTCVPVYQNTRRGILSNIRKINEPRRKA